MKKRTTFYGIVFITASLILSSCGSKSKSSSKELNTTSESPKYQDNQKQEVAISNSNVGRWIKANPKKNIFLDNEPFEFSTTFHTEDSASWKIECDELLQEITITEERTGKVIQRNKNVRSMTFLKKINHTDVYTIKVFDPQKKYFSFSVERMPMTAISAQQSIDFIYDTINTVKGAKNAVAIDQINLVKALNEPRKIVLSSKISLSGESNIILPLELPKNTTQLLYELRISGENEESANDGKLFSKVSTSIKQYKILGKTLYEKNSTESSLTREILNTISLPKREKVSANVFFFPDEKNARAFTDHNPKGFNYDTKNSLKNTESMNGIIKPQKNGFVYLGFESTSTWHNTYLWLDAVAIQIQKRYVVLKKIPKESTSY